MNKWLRIAMTVWALAWPILAGASECAGLSVARWVIGDWVAGGEKTLFHESWAELGPQTFEGMGSGRSMADGSVINAEELRLVEMAGRVYYIAKVADNDLPVAFLLTECSAGRMVVPVSDGKDQGFTLNFERGDEAKGLGAPVLAAEDGRFSAMTGANTVELGAWRADDLAYVHSTGKVENGLGGDGRWRLRSWQSLRMPQTSG